MDFIAVGIAGFFGAITRFALGKVLRFSIFGSFPFSTLFINLTGCLLLSFFLTLTLDRLVINPKLRLAFGTGFLGAYTTFSTFTVDSVNLIKNDQLVLAFIYILGTSFGAVIFAWLGLSLSRLITTAKPKEEEEAQLDLQGD